MEQIVPSVLSSVKQSSTFRPSTASLWETIQGFFHAIDWTEPFIVGLLTVLLTFFLVTIITRRVFTLQVVLFFTYAALIFGAKSINDGLRPLWRAFASQNYFDPAGIFISVMMSLPLALIMVFQVVSTRAAKMMKTLRMSDGCDHYLT